MVRLAAALVLVFRSVLPLAADEALTQGELEEMTASLEAVRGADADFAGAERKARDLYGLVLRDFGAETRRGGAG